MKADDWLIEAARRPMVRCSHRIDPETMFCTHCHRSAEDIHNEALARSVPHDGHAKAHKTASIPAPDGNWYWEMPFPEGMVMKDGKLHATCRSCDKLYEWPAEIEDFDPTDNSMNYCGGSPRCCP